MQDIKHREQKIQEARKNTPWRKFLKEIASRYTLSLYKNNGVSGFPDSDRLHIVPYKDYTNNRGSFELTPSGNFLKDIQTLRRTLPTPNTFKWGVAENCDFSFKSFNAKNVYMSFEVMSENVLYSVSIKNDNKNVLNSCFVSNSSENIYQSQGIVTSYNIYFSSNIENSNNIRSSSNLQGCTECTLCQNLQNQSYCFNNEALSKHEYEKRKSSFLKEQLSSGSFPQGPKLGNTSAKCHNTENVDYCTGLQHSRNCLFTGSEGGNHSLYDTISAGAPQGNSYYGVLGAGHGDHFYCSFEILGGERIYYSYNLEHCSYCLGCMNLKNKSFCILNKQYSKEEWFEKTNEIFTQMESDGTLGKFFPGTMNPFYFNDTVAYSIDPSFSKEEVEAEGYLRRNKPIKVDIPEGSQVVKTTELDQYQGFDADGSRSINADILKKVIVDEKGDAYRIVKMEYDFLMKHELPLPRLHWLDRIKLGFKFNS